MDKSKLDMLIGDFHTVTGMEISILDADFHSIAIRRCPYKNLCSYLHTAASALDVCKASDIERLLEARQTGEPLLYTCPAGITEVIVPVVSGEKTAAYLFSSMGVASDRISDGEILERSLSIAPRLNADTLTEYISRFKHLNDGELSAHFRLLKLLSEHIASDEGLLSGEESIGTLIKIYIKSHLTRKLTLSDISWNLHCSTVTLTEHFKKEFGITIMEYVTKKRMQLAERLLITTDKTLGEIALMSGFSDVEYFSRVFKRYHSTPPGEWRKDNKSV